MDSDPGDIDPRDRPGRWRCLLCRGHRWRRGTLRDGEYHHIIMHTDSQETQ